MADEKTHTKADIDAAVTAAVAKVQESIDRLETKNEELVGELRTAKAEIRKSKDIKPEDLTAAEDRADKAEAALSEASKQLKTITGERDKAVKSLETEQSVTHKLVAENGLRELLLKGGVTDPDFLDMAVGKYLPGVKVDANGDGRKAMYGDKELAAFVTELLASDAGKKIVTAANNSGGGASGGSGKSGGKVASQAEFDAMKPKDRSSFFSDGGTIAQAA